MPKLSNPYKIGVIGLLTILAITIVPFDGETNSNEGKLYGLLTLVQYDENSNEVFSQSIHNRLVNTGETFLLEAGFRDSIAPADNLQIGAICIAQGTIDAADEAESAADFDTANSQTSGTNCIVDAAVDITTTQGQAVIGPETFTGGTHIAAGETVNGIGICQSNAGTTPYTDCINGDGAASGILFAIIDTADVTLAASETVQVTYTFDITSPSD